MRTHTIRSLQLACLLLVTISADALARDVYVNGQMMGERQLFALDAMTCNKVPNGRYWVDPRTGQWGFEGQGPKGYIGELCPGYRIWTYDPRIHGYGGR